MRLIDADALFKEVTEGIYTTGNIFKDMALQNFINAQPTAYDVDAVVKELEEEVEKSTISGMGGISCNIDETKIIDIVKRGGIE